MSKYTHSQYDGIGQLNRLSSDALAIGIQMDYYGGTGAMGEHGRELTGAANIMRQWVRALESGDANIGG